MKVGCCGLGIIGMIVNVLTKCVEVLISVIVYLGLYVPMFYLLVVLGLWLWGGMTFEPSLELNLFYVGLAISLLCSVILTLRHLIFEPFGKYLDRKEEERLLREARREDARKARRRSDMERDRRGYRDERRERDYPPPREDYRRHDGRSNRIDYRERPLVYRSRNDSSLIIYEFSDRFEVYREGERGLRHIDTRWK